MCKGAAENSGLVLLISKAEVRFASPAVKPSYFGLVNA
jgi:hypothetical protein